MQNNNFTTDDLQAGMLVKLKNEKVGVLIPVEGELEVYDKDYTPLCNAYLYNENTNEICRHKEDMYDPITIEYSIVEVYGLSKNFSLFDKCVRELLWRYEPTIIRKKMTLEEIEKELGYKIEIV